MMAAPSHFERLPTRELWNTQQRWREIYAANLHAQTGRWIHRGFDWHVFSYGFCEHVSGQQAIEEARLLVPAQVFLFADLGSERQWGATGELTSLPSSTTQQDVIIVSQDFSWTLARTHEAEHGPFFSRCAWASDPHA